MKSIEQQRLHLLSIREGIGHVDGDDSPIYDQCRNNGAIWARRPQSLGVRTGSNFGFEELIDDLKPLWDIVFSGLPNEIATQFRYGQTISIGIIGFIDGVLATWNRIES